MSVPRKPQDPENPLTSDGATFQIKVSKSFDEDLRRLAEERGVTRAAMGRELLHRGHLHLSVETAGVGDRAVFGQRIEYAFDHVDTLLREHAAADPGGAVVAARGIARALAQWADEQALSHDLALAEPTGGQS